MESRKNNQIIMPQKRERINNKKNKSIHKINLLSLKKKSSYKTVNRSNNFRNKKYEKNKKKIEFNSLKFTELVSKIQIICMLIIIVMIVYNKYDLLENLIEDELSVFGEGNVVDDIGIDTENDVSVISTNTIEFEQDDEKIILGVQDVSVEQRVDVVNESIISYMTGNTFDEIFNNNYVVDSRAGVVDSMFDFELFESKDLTLENTNDAFNEDEPKVLIFHTHGSEQYKDSADINEGVYLLGRTLEEELETKYGISALHIEKRYDMVDGQTQILGAYERMEPDILAILEKYPSIEVCIDIHRDGLPDHMKQVVNIDGNDYAPLMFVNGLSSYNNNGVIESLTDLENPNRADNLAFSYRMKQAINSSYDGLVKDIYINAYRYSLHMKPKSLLLEVGAQNNTVEESVRSIKKFAEILAEVLTEE